MYVPSQSSTYRTTCEQSRVNKAADRMTNNWRRAMAAAAARQGHVAQAEAQNN